MLQTYHIIVAKVVAKLLQILEVWFDFLCSTHIHWFMSMVDVQHATQPRSSSRWGFGPSMTQDTVQQQEWLAQLRSHLEEESDRQYKEHERLLQEEKEQWSQWSQYSSQCFSTEETGPLPPMESEYIRSLGAKNLLTQLGPFDPSTKKGWSRMKRTLFLYTHPDKQRPESQFHDEINRYIEAWHEYHCAECPMDVDIPTAVHQPPLDLIVPVVDHAPLEATVPVVAEPQPSTLQPLINKDDTVDSLKISQKRKAKCVKKPPVKKTKCIKKSLAKKKKGAKPSPTTHDNNFASVPKWMLLASIIANVCQRTQQKIGIGDVYDDCFAFHSDEFRGNYSVSIKKHYVQTIQSRLRNIMLKQGGKIQVNGMVLVLHMSPSKRNGYCSNLFTVENL